MRKISANQYPQNRKVHLTGLRTCSDRFRLEIKSGVHQHSFAGFLAKLDVLF
jgi:hypothetical protein